MRVVVVENGHALRVVVGADQGANRPRTDAVNVCCSAHNLRRNRTSVDTTHEHRGRGASAKSSRHAGLRLWQLSAFAIALGASLAVASYGARGRGLA